MSCSSPVLGVADLMAKCGLRSRTMPRPLPVRLILIVLFSLRYVRSHREGITAYALWGSRAVVMVLALWMISPIPLGPVHDLALAISRTAPRTPRLSDTDAIPTCPDSVRIGGAGRKHLVIVGYPSHDIPHGSGSTMKPISITPRSFGPATWDTCGNLDLLEHYPDRQVWYVDRGDVTASLVPYDPREHSLQAGLRSRRPRERFPGESEASPQPASAAARMTQRPAAAALAVGSR